MRSRPAQGLSWWPTPRATPWSRTAVRRRTRRQVWENSSGSPASGACTNGGPGAEDDGEPTEDRERGEVLPQEQPGPRDAHHRLDELDLADLRHRSHGQSPVPGDEPEEHADHSEGGRQRRPLDRGGLRSLLHRRHTGSGDPSAGHRRPATRTRSARHPARARARDGSGVFRHCFHRYHRNCRRRTHEVGQKTGHRQGRAALECSTHQSGRGSASSGVPASRASRIRARPRRRRLDRSRTRNSPTLSSTERLALPSAWRPTPAAVPRRKRLRPFNSLPVTRTAMSSRYHACFF